jgi:DNA-binding response OmpR family regulator
MRYINMPQGSSVLIVDDDESIRIILAEVLAKEGYDIAEAETGEEALEMLRQRDFDVVLTDLMMPVTDGMELLTIIRKLKPETRVIMITAFATIESAVEAMRKGASDYIAKPFDAEDVRKIVKRTLEEAKFSSRVAKPLKLKEGKVKLQSLIRSLSSPIRRDIVEYLFSRRDASFMQIVAGIGIEDHTKLSFHLRKLKTSGIVKQDKEKRYSLSEKGVKVAEILRSLKERAAG